MKYICRQISHALARSPFLTVTKFSCHWHKGQGSRASTSTHKWKHCYFWYNHRFEGVVQDLQLIIVNLIPLVWSNQPGYFNMKKHRKKNFNTERLFIFLRLNYGILTASLGVPFFEKTPCSKSGQKLATLGKWPTFCGKVGHYRYSPCMYINVNGYERFNRSIISY